MGTDDSDWKVEVVADPPDKIERTSFASSSLVNQVESIVNGIKVCVHAASTCEREPRQQW